MLKIVTSNLPTPVQGSVEEDLAAIVRLAPERGVVIPDCSVHIVSLANSGVSSNLPQHTIARPAEEMPNAFKARCEWEKRRQSFQILRDGATIWIIGGGPEGGLYGFSEVLQCLTGVIWEGMGDDDVLFGSPRPLPSNVQSLRMVFRGRDTGPPGDMHQFIRWLGRNRYNLWRRNSAFWVTRSPEYQEAVLQGCESRCIHLTLGDHAMQYLLPDADLDQHPQWQGMRDGVRCKKTFVTMPDVPHLNAELPVQPCYSNTELVEVLTDRIAAHMKENPQFGFFGLWPHDGVNNWCQC